MSLAHFQRRTLLLLLILMPCLLFNCSTGQKSRFPDFPSKETFRKYPKSKRIPATQRPYSIRGKLYVPLASAHGFAQTGKASWYGPNFHGRKTSNGEIYNMYGMTAAHKTLPMNTWVMVYNLENDRSIKVRINDRGPFIHGRIIDLTYTGAKALGILGPGTAKVKIEALGQATAYSKKTKLPVAFQPLDYWKGNFSVQLGAFKNWSNAEAFRKKLFQKYSNVQISAYQYDQDLFYRVRLGHFTNLQDAELFAKRLSSENFDVFVVAD